MCHPDDPKSRKREEVVRQSPSWPGVRNRCRMLSSLGPAAPAQFGVSFLQAMPLQDSPRESLDTSTHLLPPPAVASGVGSDSICVVFGGRLRLDLPTTPPQESTISISGTGVGFFLTCLILFLFFVYFFN